MMRSSTGELGSTICDGETKVSSTQRESGTNRALAEHFHVLPTHVQCIETPDGVF